jgi:hypothetical protein
VSLRGAPRRSAALAACLFVVALESSAFGFCRTTTCNKKKEACSVDERQCVVDGAPARWKRMPLVFRFKRGGLTTLVREEARAAVRAAFYRWSDVACPGGQRTSLRFVEGEEIGEDKALTPDARAAESFGVFFRDLGWPHKDSDRTYALTTLDFVKRTGVVTYADMELNTTAHTLSTGDGDGDVDLQTVATHEVGHYIGLAHSIEENSIMAEGLCEGGDRCARGKVAARRLAEDDLAAVCALYPPWATYEDDAPQGCDIAPRGEGAPRPWGAPLSTAAVLAAVWILRGRRASR